MKKFIPSIIFLAITFGMIIVITFLVGSSPVQSIAIPDNSYPKESLKINKKIPTKIKSYALLEIKSHFDKISCWTTIGGKVYDLTLWISQHPGGESAILSICGKDGTSAFMGKHGGQSRPEQELAKFFIGNLK